MAGRIDNSGRSWWSSFCCCSDSTSIEGSDREKLKGATTGTSEHPEGSKRADSPQPSYSQFTTQVAGDLSPMK